jgi:transcriptional regulator with XRE-family HTH domain
MVDNVSVLTTPSARPSDVGHLLREWRHHRRLSQLDLAVEAEVSARHLSFVETGRSRPSRELVLHLAEHLDVPLRERNTLLLAAGYAPVHRRTALEDDAMEPVRAALDKILTGHEPYPAVIVDRRWDMVAANSAIAVLTDGVASELLAPPANALRATLHPDGLAPRIVNFSEWASHLLQRLHRQWVLTADPDIAALLDEVRGYPGVNTLPPPEADPTVPLFVPLRLRTSGPMGVELSFFSTIATFGTAVDLTLAELSIESFFPADEATGAALRASRPAG